ncbi:MAG: DNA polymerase, partial [Methanospirillum sp.]|nr:DNA polymerase [Methanospirillum sp.]
MPDNADNHKQTLITVPENGDDSSGGMGISITQVEYSTAAEGPIIHIFGRTVQGEACEIRVTGFFPYFYIPVSQGDRNHPEQVIKVDDRVYYSIHGEELRRLYTRRPTDVREVRADYRHFEADIPFATRYLIDTGITGGIRIPAGTIVIPCQDVLPADVLAPSRYCLIDIECEDDKGGLPNPERDQIICITAWDSYEDRYTTFLLQNSGQTIEPGNICAHVLPNG